MRLPVLVASLLLLSQLCKGAQPAPDRDGGTSIAQSDVGQLLLLLGEDRAAPWLRPAPGPDGADLPVRSVHRVAPDGELHRRRKRSESPPPLSIDLTFHLLRRLMESARRESLAAQAEENRRLMDSVGK